jgi:hypothetical protein
LGRETFAISLAAVLIVVALLSAYAGVSLAPVRTVTLVQPATATADGVYKVTFEQVQYCGEYNILPWGVSIDGLVQVQPHSQSLPLPTNTLSTIVPDKNLTQMAFYLPPGTYNYTLLGGSGFEEVYVVGEGATAGLSRSTGQMLWSMWDISKFHMHLNNNPGALSPHLTGVAAREEPPT